MKHIFLLLLTVPIFCLAQNDTTTFYFNKGAYGMSFGASAKSAGYVTIWNNNRIEITGDTAAAIHELIKFINNKDSTIESLHKVIKRGVEFANNVPDYWKEESNNCKWKDYMAALKRQGYVYDKNPKYKKNPCK